MVRDPAANRLVDSATGAEAADSLNFAADNEDEELQLVKEDVASRETESDELQLSETVKRPSTKQPWLETQPITHEQFERIKRKNRSPIWSILQVVLGGLAAFPLALLILWWGLGRDFGGAGPKVAEYVPWLVPAKFHPASDSEATTSASNSAAPERGQSGFRNFDDVMADSPNEDSDDESSTASKSLQANLPPSLDRAEPSSATSEPQMASLDRAAMIAASEAASSAPKTPTPKIEDNIFARITRCEQSIEAWRKAVLSGEGDRRQIAQDIYGELLAISEDLTNFPEDSPIFRVIRDKLQPVSRSIKRQNDVRKIVIQGAKHWSQDLSEDGLHPLALICEIETVEESEGNWIIVPTGKDSPESIDRIVIPGAIAPQLDPGQQLLLLGTLEPGKEKSEDDSAAPTRATFRAYYLHGQ